MAIFRNPFGLDPGNYGTQASGGLAALLQQAIDQQRLKQQADKSSLADITPDRLPVDADNSPGLFTRLLASQSYLGSPLTENSELTSPASLDPNFRQLSRLSPAPPQTMSVNSSAAESNPDAKAQAITKSEPGSSFRVAQALVPLIFGMPYAFCAFSTHSTQFDSTRAAA
jgi:hypothetical protein